MSGWWNTNNNKYDNKYDCREIMFTCLTACDWILIAAETVWQSSTVWLTRALVTSLSCYGALEIVGLLLTAYQEKLEFTRAMSSRKRGLKTWVHLSSLSEGFGLCLQTSVTRLGLQTLVTRAQSQANLQQQCATEDGQTPDSCIRDAILTYAQYNQLNLLHGTKN